MVNLQGFVLLIERRYLQLEQNQYIVGVDNEFLDHPPIH